METSQAVLSTILPSSTSTSIQTEPSAQASADQLVLSAIPTSSDSVNLNFQDLYKSLSITSKQIVDKLNEYLKADLPDGVQSLKPEDVTPEATADRIVSGATAFFDVFAKQNSDLSGEELLNKFLETIKSGISQGYNDASGILEGLGAFDVEGVKSGIEKTKSLIDEKLKAYETQKRIDLGIDKPVEGSVAQQTQSSILAQAAGISITA